MSLPFIHSFNNATTSNSLLFLDTSFVWESYGTSNGRTPYKQTECHNFSTKAVQGGSVFVISPIIEMELKNVAVKELLKHYAPVYGVQKHERKKIMSQVPDFMTQVHRNVEQVMEILIKDPNYVFLDDNASSKETDKVSMAYNMDLNDSIILATMFANGIDSLVTLDGDYVQVHDKNLQIYTNHQNYIKLTSNHSNIISNPPKNTNKTGS